jgi:hypothetical protein
MGAGSCEFTHTYSRQRNLDSSINIFCNIKYIIIPNEDGKGLVRDQDLEGHKEIGKRLQIEYFYTEEIRGIGKRAIVNDDFKAKHAKHGSAGTAGTAGTGGAGGAGGGRGGEKKPQQKKAGFSGFGTASKGSSSKGSSGTAHGTTTLKKRDGTPYTPAEAKKYDENLQKFNAKMNPVVEDDGPMEAWEKRDSRILLGTNQNFMLSWL